ncbi:MAG TPA: hypothetical protein VGI93_15125 [Steroidobacteraceae bacterium]|jgi:hypothetical protein
MIDQDQIKTQAEQAYGYWNSAGVWVAAHPNTTIGAAIVALIIAFCLGAAV